MRPVSLVAPTPFTLAALLAPAIPAVAILAMLTVFIAAVAIPVMIAFRASVVSGRAGKCSGHHQGCANC